MQLRLALRRLGAVIRGWLMNNAEAQDQDLARRIAQLEALFWLADAPLFVDERGVQQFFDAVVRPKYEHVGESEERETEDEHKILGKLGVGGKAGIHLPAWLKPLRADVQVSGQVGGESTKHSRNLVSSELRPIWNAERQLEELARHYLAHHRDRLLTRDGPMEPSGWPPNTQWYDAGPESIVRVPRALVFLEVEPPAMLIPTAAEFANGSIILLFEDLASRLTTEKGGPMRQYPAASADRKEYWRSYTQYYDSTAAMEVIEGASTKNGRIEWIDFRLPISADEGNTIHLHVNAAGKTSAGTFAYNFVRRAHKHGVRIVGTLKSGPDVNVIAIYDR
jgi:hypothetical protein